MQDILINKLHNYIRGNNPDLLIALEESGDVTQNLTDKVNTVSDLSQQLQKEKKPDYIIEEICMEALTRDLRPSKYNYIISILEEEFETDYRLLHKSGTITYEVINMIAYCKPVFEATGFTEENEHNRQLRYAITGTISAYIERNK